MGQDGKTPFKFNVNVNSSLGSYTFRIEYTAAIFVDITVVVVDNVSVATRSSRVGWCPHGTNAIGGAMAWKRAYGVGWRALLLGATLAMVAWGAFGDARVGMHDGEHFTIFSAEYGRFFVLRGKMVGRTITRIWPQPGRVTVKFFFSDGGNMINPFDVPGPPLVSTSLGFFYRPVRFDAMDGIWMAAPQWLVVAVCILVVGFGPAVRLIREKRRRSLGRCTRCGYDIRATPDRCPECGTVQRAATTAQADAAARAARSVL
jgi:hypothetical protein